MMQSLTTKFSKRVMYTGIYLSRYEFISSDVLQELRI